MTDGLDMLKDRIKAHSISYEETISLIDQIITSEARKADELPSLLEAACDSSNLPVVRALLEKRTDPNHPDSFGENLLWDLQYPNRDEYDDDRLKIVQMMLEYGADPCVVEDGEALYDDVLFDVFNGVEAPEDVGYVYDFFVMLILYGGYGISYPKPVFIKEVDRSRLEDYMLCLRPAGNNKLRGFLLGPDDDDVAYL